MSSTNASSSTSSRSSNGVTMAVMTDPMPGTGAIIPHVVEVEARDDVRVVVEDGPWPVDPALRAGGAAHLAALRRRVPGDARRAGAGHDGSAPAASCARGGRATSTWWPPPTRWRAMPRCARGRWPWPATTRCAAATGGSRRSGCRSRRWCPADACCSGAGAPSSRSTRALARRPLGDARARARPDRARRSRARPCEELGVAVDPGRGAHARARLGPRAAAPRGVRGARAGSGSGAGGRRRVRRRTLDALPASAGAEEFDVGRGLRPRAPAGAADRRRRVRAGAARGRNGRPASLKDHERRRDDREARRRRAASPAPSPARRAPPSSSSTRTQRMETGIWEVTPGEFDAGARPIRRVHALRRRATCAERHVRSQAVSADRAATRLPQRASAASPPVRLRHPSPPGRALPSPGGALRPRTDRAQRRGGRRALAGARRRLRGAGRGQRGGRGRRRSSARSTTSTRASRSPSRAAGSAIRATAGASWPSAPASRSPPASRRCSPTWARSSTSGRAGRQWLLERHGPEQVLAADRPRPRARAARGARASGRRGSARRCARGRTRARCARCGCSSRSTASPRRWPRASTAPTARAPSRRCARTPTG